MTEGEEFIEEYFQSEKIKYRKETPIDALKFDSKNYRVAEFYLPEYKIYVELFQSMGSRFTKRKI